MLHFLAGRRVWLWRAAPGCVWALCVQLLTRVRASSQRGLHGAWLADGQPERGPCQQVPIACCLCWCTVHGVADAKACYLRVHGCCSAVLV